MESQISQNRFVNLPEKANLDFADVLQKQEQIGTDFDLNTALACVNFSGQALRQYLALLEQGGDVKTMHG